MKKLKTKSASQISIEDGLQFIEDMRVMASQVDEPTVAISLRVPANLLRNLKVKAKISHSKYQSLIIEYIRQGLKKS